MNDLIPVDELLHDHAGGHSDLQMTSFIVGREGHGTAYGAYRQCLRELDARHRSLRQLGRDRERLQLELADLKRRAGRWWRSRRARRLDAIAMDEKLDAHDQLAGAILDAGREHTRFHQLASDLKQQLGEIAPARREQLDHAYWLQRLRTQAALELATMGTVSKNLLELVLSLAPNDRNQLLTDLQAGRESLVASVLSPRLIGVQSEAVADAAA